MKHKKELSAQCFFFVFFVTPTTPRRLFFALLMSCVVRAVQVEHIRFDPGLKAHLAFDVLLFNVLILEESTSLSKRFAHQLSSNLAPPNLAPPTSRACFKRRRARALTTRWGWGG